MMTVCRTNEREHSRRRRSERWLSRLDGDDDSARLATLTESRIPPRQPHPSHLPCDAELVTYVREGSLSYVAATGRTGLLGTGEFQRMSVGGGARFSGANASRASFARIYQVLLRATLPLATSHEQRLFSVAERRGIWCLIASSIPQRGVLLLQRDARVYSAMLSPGHHVVHELAEGRTSWVHVLDGAVALHDVVLASGDGARVTAERAISVTARMETELLIVDLG